VYSEPLSQINASNMGKAMLGNRIFFFVNSIALTRPYRSPMGMAAIGIALYKYVMKYSPKNCNYFNRDRFVLSNGMSSELLPGSIIFETK
jgi:hypothetical protein